MSVVGDGCRWVVMDVCWWQWMLLVCDECLWMMMDVGGLQ